VGDAIPTQRMSEKEVRVLPEELAYVKQMIAETIQQELKKVENYGFFRFRYMKGLGLGMEYANEMYEEEGEEGVAFHLHIRIFVPKQTIYKVAVAKKRRKFKPPRLHPTIRQQLREADEVAEEMLSSVEGGVGGEGDG